MEVTGRFRSIASINLDPPNPIPNIRILCLDQDRERAVWTAPVVVIISRTDRAYMPALLKGAYEAGRVVVVFVEDFKPNHPWVGFRNIAKVLERPERLDWVLLLTGMIEHPEPITAPADILIEQKPGPEVIHRPRRGTIIDEIGGEQHTDVAQSRRRPLKAPQAKVWNRWIARHLPLALDILPLGLARRRRSKTAEDVREVKALLICLKRKLKP